jgi:hypothetical protein
MHAQPPLYLILVHVIASEIHLETLDTHANFGNRPFFLPAIKPIFIEFNLKRSFMSDCEQNYELHIGWLGPQIAVDQGRLGSAVRDGGGV